MKSCQNRFFKTPMYRVRQGSAMTIIFEVSAQKDIQLRQSGRSQYKELTFRLKFGRKSRSVNRRKCRKSVAGFVTKGGRIQDSGKLGFHAVKDRVIPRLDFNNLVTVQGHTNLFWCDFDRPDNFQDTMVIDEIPWLNLRKFFYSYHNSKIVFLRFY